LDEIFSILRQIPRFAGVQPQDVTLTRLGGLTNTNWKVDHGGEAFVLRIAGVGTEAYIDRHNEETNARAAAAAGVGAEVLHFDAKTGLMLTRYLAGTITMTNVLFAQRKGAPARAALALKQMHRSGQRLANRFELFAMIEDYKAHLAKLGAKLPDGYNDAVKQAGAVKAALEAAPVELAPCHCDPLCENFLDDGQRMRIVDWEYSGMNDPWWDLGDIAVEAGFNAAQEREMLEAYCGGPAPAWAVGRVVIYKAMCDLLWTLWGLIQHVNKNPVDDFWTYALNRFVRCHILMGDRAFPQHLRAVRMHSQD
jgi:thiamine kinase-like enzyme